MFLSAHVAEAAPHHLELIDQLLVQGTHFWVHQLLVHSQAVYKLWISAPLVKFVLFYF